MAYFVEMRLNIIEPIDDHRYRKIEDIACALLKFSSNCVHTYLQTLYFKRLNFFVIRFVQVSLLLLEPRLPVPQI